MTVELSHVRISNGLERSRDILFMPFDPALILNHTTEIVPRPIRAKTA